MTKKNITTQILALLALACLALAPAGAQASEVTGTLSSDGTVTINQAEDDDELGGEVVDDDDGLSGEVVDDDDDNGLSGTVVDDDDGGSGGGGIVRSGGGGGDDDNGGGGTVLGAQTTPLIPQTGGFLPTVLGATTPGLPNTGEPFEGGTSATAGWTVVLASILATLAIAFMLYFLMKEAKREGGMGQ